MSRAIPDAGGADPEGRIADPSRRRIRRLTGALIDQIAAGEVVERPVSVVKELVENALDAGADRIRVEVRGGGRDWIAVSDDGSGMSPTDARLAVERHATSKIGSPEDLARIRTFGFRGEALAAIASISRLRLRTRAADAEVATELRIEVGEVLEEREVGAPVGTRIEVADLFAGVPARRKFLKKPVTEWGHIADWLGRVALALPDVHFDIRRDDRPATSWPAAPDPLDRVASVLGEDDAAALTRVEHTEGNARLHGFVSRPERHRATAAGIHLYVNGRPVRDRVLQHALVEVYRDWLPRGRYPSAVLFIELPYDEVDVNVHPAKWEVRFADPRSIHALVRHGVRAAVSGRGWLAGPGEPGSASAAEWAQRSGRGAARPEAVGEGASGSPGDWTFAAPRQLTGPGVPPSLVGDEAPRDPATELRVRFADLPLLGQLLATYLVLETKDQLLLIDQHAAHERVLFERLRAEWLERGVESQGLLAPITVRLAPHALAALMVAREASERLGFDWEDFGDDTVAIRAVPALLGESDPAPLLRNLADELAASGTDGSDIRPGARGLEAADRLFASLACHSARRKGDVLEPIEQRALLDALDSIPWAPCCPHGRPVAVPIELAEIERRFSRR